jgi:hypothetical protein
VYVAKTREEKAMQRALMQCHVRKNWPLIRKALRQADRDDLIGTGKGCLVPPDFREGQAAPYGAKRTSAKRTGSAQYNRNDFRGGSRNAPGKKSGKKNGGKRSGKKGRA